MLSRTTLNVNTLREELEAFRASLLIQERELIDETVRHALLQELRNFFENNPSLADALITHPSGQIGVQDLPESVDMSKSNTYASNLDFQQINSRQSAHASISRAEMQQVGSSTRDVGQSDWTHRHRKSYLLRTEENENQAEATRRSSRRVGSDPGDVISRSASDNIASEILEVDLGVSSAQLTSQLTTSRPVSLYSQAGAGMTMFGSAATSSLQIGHVTSRRMQQPLQQESNPRLSERALEQTEQPSWTRRHRKAKRMSTVGNEGLDTFVAPADNLIGPYNIARDRNGYAALPNVPNGSQSIETPGIEPHSVNTVWPVFWGPVRTTVLSYRFDYMIAVLIILNAISIGVQTDYMARNWTDDTPMCYRVVNLIFCGVFTVEILLKLCVHGTNFFHSTAWRWNIFDTVVVTAQTFEELTLLMADVFNPHYVGRARSLMQFMFFSVIRTLRVFRLIRVMRIVSIIHLVGDLRKFVVAITDSMQSLGWTVLLLLLITYIFAVYLTQLVTDYKVRHAEKVRAEQHLLQEFYGSLDRSMLSLYETISDGIHWHEVMDPLKDITPWLSVLFAVYISGIVFALMNVVTGIFVDSAIRAAETDKKRDLVDSMRSLFEGADEDGNGTLTFEEFEGQLGNRFMQAYLQAIDLDEEEAVMLFQLLDIDESGEIEADDFVSGCIKLHGGAKAIDLAAFVHEFRRTAKQWNYRFDLVERSLSWLCEQFSKTSAQRERTY